MTVLLEDVSWRLGTNLPLKHDVLYFTTCDGKSTYRLWVQIFDFHERQHSEGHSYGCKWNYIWTVEPYDILKVRSTFVQSLRTAAQSTQTSQNCFVPWLWFWHPCNLSSLFSTPRVVLAPFVYSSTGYIISTPPHWKCPGF